MTVWKKLFVIGVGTVLVGCATTGSQSVKDIPNTTAGMGERYLLGHGVPQNNQKAFTYFEKAANEGDVFAQNEVAYMYAAGKGTHKDSAKALMWYKKAAERGLASAQYNLGLMYMNGIGTVTNKTEAMKWLQKSAKNKFEPALVALGQYRS